MLMNCLAQMNGEMSELCLYLLIFKLNFLPQLIKTGGWMRVVDVHGVLVAYLKQSCFLICFP